MEGKKIQTKTLRLQHHPSQAARAVHQARPEGSGLTLLEPGSSATSLLATVRVYSVNNRTLYVHIDENTTAYSSGAELAAY